MLRRSLKRKLEKTVSVFVNKEDTSDHETVTEVLGSTKKDDHIEKVLKEIVFGEDHELIGQLGDKKQTSKTKKTRKNIFPFEEERTPAWIDEEDEANSISVSRHEQTPLLKSGESITAKAYTKRLESHFKKIISQPNWAQPFYKESNSDNDDNDVEDLLRSTGNYITRSSTLPNGHIHIKQCINVNKECPTKGKLTSVEFHPTAQVILTAGMDQTLNLFQVDGKTNKKIQGVYLDSFPISMAHFSCSGHEVILGSWLRAFYCYDMIAGKVINIPKIKALEGDVMAKFKVSPDGRFLVFLGKYGCIHILSARSKEWIQTLKMNGSVMCVAFSNDGSKMYSVGDEGCVYVWDMKTLDCVHRFYDEGCFRGTTVAVSPNNQYLCCGSYSGIVNIYDASKCLTSKYPKPERSAGNLTTSVTCSLFNSSSEILGIASNSELAIKFVHFPSFKVFSNFPSQTDTTIRVPKCFDFSLNSGYLAIGNHRGNALLYRLKHFGSY